MSASNRSQFYVVILLVLVLAAAYFIIRRALIVKDAEQALGTTRFVWSKAPRAVFVDQSALQEVFDRLPDSLKKELMNWSVNDEVQVVVFEGDFAIQPPHTDSTPVSTDVMQCVAVLSNIERGGRTIFHTNCDRWK